MLAEALIIAEGVTGIDAVVLARASRVELLDSVSDERSALAEHSTFSLDAGVSALEVWDDDAIEKRACELAEVARGVWPRPSAAGVRRDPSSRLVLPCSIWIALG